MITLFARTMPDRFATIRRILMNERTMRLQVFRTKPDMQARKVQEIDIALADLADIEMEFNRLNQGGDKRD